MKKLIAYVLTLALLCVPLAACGGQQPDPSDPAGSGTSQAPPEGASPEGAPEDLSEITHRLLADWYGYVARCEYLYGDMLWAVSYLEPFFEDHSWDSLQTARAAQSLAQRRAELIGPPEAAQMSFEDYDKLVQSGADVSPVQLAVDSISSLKSSVLVDHQLYQSSLNSPSEELFLTYQLAHFEHWANLIRQICELNLQSCAIETDYVLLELDHEEEEARFIEAITEKCPQINARRSDDPQDPDALLMELSAVLDELERRTNELNEVEGQAQAGLDLYRDALESALSGAADALDQYVASMSADAVDLTGFPSALPYPSWWYAQEAGEILYTWNVGEEKKSLLPGDPIEAPPDQSYITWPDVSLEDFQAYLDTLAGYGLPAEAVTEREGTYTAFFQLQTGSCALIWEESKTSFLATEGSVCFAPPWYVICGLGTARFQT